MSQGFYPPPPTASPPGAEAAAGSYPPPPPTGPEATAGYYPPHPLAATSPPSPPLLREWETSLCGCFDDCSSCCCGFWCPCVQFGRNYNRLNMGGECAGCCLYFILSMFFLQCVMGVSARNELKRQFSIKHSCCGAFCTYCFCTPCAVCQDAREVKYQQQHGQSQFVGYAPAPATVPANAPPPVQAMK